MSVSTIYYNFLNIVRNSKHKLAGSLLDVFSAVFLMRPRFTQLLSLKQCRCFTPASRGEDCETGHLACRNRRLLGTLNQGFSNFFLLRPRFEKYISTRPHYVHIHVNNIKTLPSTANYMVNVCPLRRVISNSLLTTKLQNNANAQE